MQPSHPNINVGIHFSVDRTHECCTVNERNFSTKWDERWQMNKQVHENGQEGLTRHLTKTGTLEQGATNMLKDNRGNELYGQSTNDGYPVWRQGQKGVAKTRQIRMIGTSNDM